MFQSWFMELLSYSSFRLNENEKKIFLSYFSPKLPASFTDKNCKKLVQFLTMRAK